MTRCTCCDLPTTMCGKTAEQRQPALFQPPTKPTQSLGREPETPTNLGPLLDVWVPGRPAPQGSKRYLGPGRPMVESSKAVEPWRADIRTRCLATHAGPPLTSGLAVALEFVLPRPTATPKRRTPPAVKRPDLDKLIRAVLDAITSAGVWTDDSQVVHLDARKRLAEIGETPGCRIVIRAGYGTITSEEAT